jgi:hypothetical protein
MSVMTELFVSTEESAVTYESRRATSFERVQIGGLTSLEFETLWAILEGEEWDPDKHLLTEITSTESSWVHQFPGRYLELLENLSDSTKRPVVAAWAATEELSAPPAEVAPVIDTLVALARSAIKKGQGLFVWTST